MYCKNKYLRVAQSIYLLWLTIIYFEIQSYVKYLPEYKKNWAKNKEKI